VRLRSIAAIGVPLALGGASIAGFLNHRNGAAEAEAAAKRVLGRADSPSVPFRLSMVDGQPEIARRYFAHAIAPGTPLRTSVELEMRGTFLLGDKRSFQRFDMTARQVLRPPFEFVWMPRLTSRFMTISGSDALVEDRGWTRFWAAGLVPVANVGTSPDMVRSAAFRAATEGVWVPASLLPQSGVQWEQVGPNTARVTVTRTQPAIMLELTIDEAGALKEIVGQRWSNANPEQRFRLQPFGGTMEAEATFEGYTIPSRLKVGNHFGTEDYLPFFQAEIVSARYR
jgi:hypothetical protein